MTMHDAFRRCSAIASLWTMQSIAVAQPIQFEIDPIHTQIVFRVDHAGFSESFGLLLRPKGTVIFDADAWENSSVVVQMQSAQLQFHDEAWNKAVLGKNYANAAEFPSISFKSIKLNPLVAQKALLVGELTLLGKTRVVELDIEFKKRAKHPYTLKDTIGFHATTRFKRSDFGMTSTLKTVGDWIDVQISLEANRPAPSLAPKGAKK
jgi:polyisoprenoid-binding protein YceI